MRFVIVGSGRVGLRTARVLDESGHEVVVIDSDDAKVARAREEGYDAIEGDGAMEATLDEADLDSADALGALTGDLNDNFVACMIAKEHGCRTVMRIDEDYREEIYRTYAEDVDEVIYPERLGAIAAKNALLGGSIRAVADVAHNLQLVELTVTEQSPVRGYSLSELELPAHSTMMAFGKDGEPARLATDDDTLELGDHLIVLADFDALSDVRSIVVGETGRKAAAGGV
ncbi:trk system potassium uptake protein TrkA [Halomicrobium zhouii]|uniref:Trk system potassium uptake protein TrkA n=1 Tax=Halomicrobium zhouii TaxID=767519 RepID=A0A1I6KLP3_9EURY|nr:TrkA family potassium uptake protein [Halomicrobium zhouii]SFR92064.1 trk system potassium uptake protein TrkA [Halomicrobium zhouii]